MDRSDQKPPQTIRLADYTPPAFRILHTDLTFHLDPNRTRVHARLKMQRSEAGGSEPLRLDGDALRTIRVAVDGNELDASHYTIDDNQLSLPSVPDAFELETEVEIDPTANTALSGLYASSGNLCTQCEAEGFRRITWFLDRPDVLSVYRTKLIADAVAYPVLLGNGDQIEQGEQDDGRHYVVWEDPWPKPAYLFALVAGRLEFVQRDVETASGKPVCLRVYAEPHNVDKCHFALDSLEKAMRWDERVYGREYDLSVYNVVAVDDFNMGAMENKGLNIFNSKYVLASPATATDADYQNIEGVIGHEYFHNWSGNRVTCRDWFQLSLKEGFTVFRDQQFTADTASPGVKRIQDVNVLRTHQFREDAGPMAHPVQPKRYVEINNFYTVTIYNKGAEVVRMLHQLAGVEDFRRGTDLYFSRHDGEAVTINEFVAAIGEASGLELEQFKRWYDQAGTPKIKMNRIVGDDGSYQINFSQSCADTPDQSDKQPFHIPLAFAMIGTDGARQTLEFSDSRSVSMAADGRSAVLHLNEAEQQFSLAAVPTGSVPSVLRGFSAPIQLETDLSDQELTQLMAHDDDPFNRWEAGQRLASTTVLKLAAGEDAKAEVSTFSDAFGQTLDAEIEDLAFKAEALTLPSQSLLAESMEVIEPESLHQAWQALRLQLLKDHRHRLLNLYANLASDETYQPDPASAGRRALRNVCLSHLCADDDEEANAVALAQYRHADNMTDQFAALRILCNGNSEARKEVIAAFYKQWQSEALVVDKWFSAQAMRPQPQVVEDVLRLASHPAFEEKNPNRARSLYGVFSAANLRGFHRRDGVGYSLAGDFVRRLDRVNPQVAARLISAFLQWRRFDPDRRSMMREQLEKTLQTPNISKDVFEIVSKSLAQ